MAGLRSPDGNRCVARRISPGATPDWQRRGGAGREVLGPFEIVRDKKSLGAERAAKSREPK